MTTVVPISSSSVTDCTVPAAAGFTAAPSSACTSMPSWVRQSAIVGSYNSSVMLNTVTVVPSRGDTTWGSSSAGSVISVSSTGSGMTTGAGFTTGWVGVTGWISSTGGVSVCSTVTGRSLRAK